MDGTIIVALVSLIGTIIGTFGGILTANKLIAYRIEQLEKKVEKHNKVVERVYVLETKEAVLEEEIEHLRAYHQP
jgi:flagellar motor component MotA